MSSATLSAAVRALGDEIDSTTDTAFQPRQSATSMQPCSVAQFSVGCRLDAPHTYSSSGLLQFMQIALEFDDFSPSFGS
jgi:hypothetical protein